MIPHRIIFTVNQVDPIVKVPVVGLHGAVTTNPASEPIRRRYSHRRLLVLNLVHVGAVGGGDLVELQLQVGLKSLPFLVKLLLLEALRQRRSARVGNLLHLLFGRGLHLRLGSLRRSVLVGIFRRGTLVVVVVVLVVGFRHKAGRFRFLLVKVVQEQGPVLGLVRIGVMSYK